MLKCIYPNAENTTINTGATILIIKPKLIANGTTFRPPDCWIIGKVKSKLVAPPSPTEADGYLRIKTGININAKNSRIKSLNNATLPQIAP